MVRQHYWTKGGKTLRYFDTWMETHQNIRQEDGKKEKYWEKNKRQEGLDKNQLDKRIERHKEGWIINCKTIEMETRKTEYWTLNRKITEY